MLPIGIKTNVQYQINGDSLKVIEIIGPLDWETAYVGIDRNFISPREVIKNIDNNQLIELNEDQLLDLFSKEDNKDEFLKLICSFFIFDDLKIIESLKKWQKGYLKMIYDSDMSINQKLKEIAKIWAMFEYPEGWKDFIYYMPLNPGIIGGEKELYVKFVSFLNRL